MTEFVKGHNDKYEESQADWLEPLHQPDRIQPLTVLKPHDDQADRRSHEQHDDEELGAGNPLPPLGELYREMVRIEQREASASGRPPFGRALAGSEQASALEFLQKTMQLDRDVASGRILPLKKGSDKVDACAPHEERQQRLADGTDSGGCRSIGRHQHGVAPRAAHLRDVPEKPNGRMARKSETLLAGCGDRHFSPQTDSRQ